MQGSPRFEQHFQGDIHSVMHWDRSLDHKEIRMMCRKKLAEIGVETGRCPHGYEQFDCACYKVIDHEMAPFEDAQKFCKKEGGSLAMPKTEQHQVKNIKSENMRYLHVFNSRAGEWSS